MYSPAKQWREGAVCTDFRAVSICAGLVPHFSRRHSSHRQSASCYTHTPCTTQCIHWPLVSLLLNHIFRGCDFIRGDTMLNMGVNIEWLKREFYFNGLENQTELTWSLGSATYHFCEWGPLLILLKLFSSL